MATVKVMVLRTAGTNCDLETCHAFQQAGADAETIHVNRLIESPGIIEEYQVLALPGGFSYGDDIAAGRILANQLIHHLSEAVASFIAAEKLVIGICNGFQVLVKAGFLPGTVDGVAGNAANNVTAGTATDNPNAASLANDGQPAQSLKQHATITWNDSARFEDRWVHLKVGTDRCVFLDAEAMLYLPIAHGEGKVCFDTPETLTRVQQQGQVALRYVDAQGHPGDYPINPNGSTDDIAALCDTTGRVLGMMPHPERFVHPSHHPHWTRLSEPAVPDGVQLFHNAVRFFAD